jgi:hypothetical protein
VTPGLHLTREPARDICSRGLRGPGRLTDPLRLRRQPGGLRPQRGDLERRPRGGRQGQGDRGRLIEQPLVSGLAAAGFYRGRDQQCGDPQLPERVSLPWQDLSRRGDRLGPAPLGERRLGREGGQPPVNGHHAAFCAEFPSLTDVGLREHPFLAPRQCRRWIGVAALDPVLIGGQPRDLPAAVHLFQAAEVTQAQLGGADDDQGFTGRVQAANLLGRLDRPLAPQDGPLVLVDPF